MATQPVALPVPRTLRVDAAEPKRRAFLALSPEDRALAAAMCRAGQAGRPLLYAQTHRHSALLAKLLARAFSAEGLERSLTLLGDQGFDEARRYAAKFFDQCGPYNPSNRKYALRDCQPTAVRNWLESLATGLPISELVALLCDPAFEARSYPESPDGSDLPGSGGNHYERGLTGEDVRKAIAGGLPLSLNSRVVRGEGGVRLTTSTTANAPALLSVVRELEVAKAHVRFPEQTQELTALIDFFQTGNVERFRAANIAWVQAGSKPTLDFLLGWIEVYEDWLARMGSWESHVQIVDRDATTAAEGLARQAGHFEANFPYGRWRKTFAGGAVPPVVLVLYLQEIASYHSAGYNLPNFDDLRRDYGAKNVVRLPFPGEDEDPNAAQQWKDVFATFAIPEEADEIATLRSRVWRQIVLLHEVVGHGSGDYDEDRYGKGVDPIAALGSLGSALEEERADLAALFCFRDSVLIQTGLVQDEADRNRCELAAYRLYLVDFLRRLSGQRSLAEAHQRGHWLLVHRALSRGAVRWVGHRLQLVDRDLFRVVVEDLLSELQHLKAEFRKDDIERLFREEAPLSAVDEPWAKEVIAKGEKLSIHGGSLEQPWRIDEKDQFVVYGQPTLAGSAPHWQNAYREVVGP